MTSTNEPPPKGQVPGFLFKREAAGGRAFSALSLGLKKMDHGESFHGFHTYGELLRRELAHTVSEPAVVDEELRHLIGALSR